MEMDREQLKLKAKQFQQNIDRQTQSAEEATVKMNQLTANIADLQVQLKKNTEDSEAQAKTTDAAHNQAILRLEGSISEKNKKIQEQDNKINQTAMELENKIQIEEKLRKQIQENLENEKHSHTQLEQKLTEKIQVLDGQNDQQLKEIATYKSQLSDLDAEKSLLS